ncbi:unnamed protein product [Rotaria sp. Silwood2]|nr:unnamed protein product [Rotaria sp. Silwood2]
MGYLRSRPAISIEHPYWEIGCLSRAMTLSGIGLQQPAYMSDKNLCRYGVLNNVQPTFNNETTKEQQIVYYTAPVNIQPINTPQPYVHVQTLSNSQTVNQYSPTRLIMQHDPQQQQLLSSNNVISTNIQ